MFRKYRKRRYLFSYSYLQIYVTALTIWEIKPPCRGLFQKWYFFHPPLFSCLPRFWQCWRPFWYFWRSFCLILFWLRHPPFLRWIRKFLEPMFHRWKRSSKYKSIYKLLLWYQIDRAKSSWWSISSPGKIIRLVCSQWRI